MVSTMWKRVGVKISVSLRSLTPAADTLSFQPAIFLAGLELAAISVGIAFALFEISERHATAARSRMNVPGGFHQVGCLHATSFDLSSRCIVRSYNP